MRTTIATRVILSACLLGAPLCVSAQVTAKLRPQLAQTLREYGYRVYPDGVAIDWKTCQDILPEELHAEGIGYDQKGRMTMFDEPVSLDPPFPLWIVDAFISIRTTLWATYKTPPERTSSSTAFKECVEEHRKGGASAEPDPTLTRFLEKRGFKLTRGGDVLELRTGAKISRSALEAIGLGLNAKGRFAKFGGLEKGGLVLTSEGKPLGSEPLEIWVPSIGQTELADQETAHAISALFGVREAGDISPQFAGSVLQSWGILPAFDGNKLLNPDGSATPMGVLLYQGLSKNVDSIDKISVERVAQSLNSARSILTAQTQEGNADSWTNLGQAWDNLSHPQIASGELPFDLKPYPEMKGALTDYRAALREQADQVKGKHGKNDERRDLRRALKALNELERHHYYPSMKLPEVPEPQSQTPASAPETQPQKASLPPRTRLLPVLLRSLNKIGPLSSEQAEALVKTFPMGESVWRMGAQELWKKGLTGKGVKIGVIDSGIEYHREMEGVVQARRDVTYTGETTPGMVHATHVAGTIHALAPDAKLHSYKVFDPKDSGVAKDHLILKAIDTAVADGNNVINLSLGSPADVFKTEKRRLLSRINKYSRQGVIFVISSGNGREDGDLGVASPSIAREAVSSGALDITNRITGFTQYGPTYDATTRKKVRKKIFLTPGTHIISSTAKDGYQGMNGTSMSAPHLTGSFGLLVGGMLDAGATLSPSALARAVKKAVSETARPLASKDHPTDADVSDELVIVDPIAAFQRLQR